MWEWTIRRRNYLGSEPAPYLGPVVPFAGRLVQLVDVQSLLPSTVSESLFREAEVTP